MPLTLAWRSVNLNTEEITKAVVYTEYGSPDVLQLQEVEKPTPEHDQVLIKVHASTVNIGDCRVRSWTVPPLFWIPYRIAIGLRRPKQPILGAVVAGEIEAVGKDVKRFRKGDSVYGMDIDGRGAHAEYMCRSEEGVLAIKPANMTYEEAAAVPVGGLEALHFLRQGNIQSGQKVLINGAGGTIGTFAVQLAKYFGAKVTGVDSTGKLNILRSIGADQVIDYTQEDFTKSGRTYDVIFDVVGKSSYSGSTRSLKETGFYLIANPQLSKMVRGLWTSKRSGKKVISGAASHKAADLIFLKELIEAGMLKSVIDRRYPLEQMAEAHRYVETGQKKGNVVITLEENS
jgi:NADPH:quinone reductase-like Zn-dependent oxidoreductase